MVVLGHSYCVLYIPQFKGSGTRKSHAIAHHSEMVSWHKRKEMLHAKETKPVLSILALGHSPQYLLSTKLPR